VTTPVRADGFDPLGDDSLVATLPDATARVLVAGNPAYLTESEAKRAVAPRLGAARERSPDAWVGTEGVERLALAAGGTQFELLSTTTEREVRAMRAAGFDGEVALYAPTVLTEDPDEALDAVGGYVARRRPVRLALPEDAATDATATGRAREVLLEAVTDFTLVGDPETVRERIGTLRSVGVDHVVAYPARGLEVFT
jgi:alkanesulfonate monooxygenase SsuD/methylene tetrahydromethanopterin reductase-like flavin-dependent oxidoreductase (luciferase family)